MVVENKDFILVIFKVMPLTKVLAIAGVLVLKSHIES